MRRLSPPWRPLEHVEFQVLTKRIIPCLDVDRGRVVKGVNFINLRDAGDPAEMAALYDREGADELVFLDITASSDARETMVGVVEQVSEQVFIPMTVGGGIRSVRDVRRMLEAGADKVSINTAAIRDPSLIAEASEFFGSQCIVAAIDSKSVAERGAGMQVTETVDANVRLGEGSRWEAYTHGGRYPAGIDAVKWARHVAALGAGELLITSMDTDGRQGRLRPRSHGRRLGGGVRARNRQRRRGYARTLSRSSDGRQGRRGACGQCVPLRDLSHCRREELSRCEGRARSTHHVTRPACQYFSSKVIGMEPVRLDHKGLVPAIAQNATTREVLMLGYMNPGSLKRTLEGGEVWFYSRSRADLWHKGEVSGNYMRVKSASMDCDRDVLLLQVEPDGPICHTGNATCFFTPFEELPDFVREEKGPGVLEDLFGVIQDRKKDMPEESYTTNLLKGGADRIAKKVVEEAGEVAIAGVKGSREEVVREMADLVYHSLVLLSALGGKPDELWEELRQRRK